MSGCGPQQPAPTTQKEHPRASRVAPVNMTARPSPHHRPPTFALNPIPYPYPYPRLFHSQIVSPRLFLSYPSVHRLPSSTLPYPIDLSIPTEQVSRSVHFHATRRHHRYPGRASPPYIKERPVTLNAFLDACETFSLAIYHLDLSNSVFSDLIENPSLGYFTCSLHHPSTYTHPIPHQHST